jgi:non-specific protein-tyrosine kinase
MSNLATVLAQGGQRVILVDADLRKPRLHKVFTGLANRTGLTNLLLADARVDLEPLLQLTPVQNLRVLTTGPLPPNPSDVLNSPRMREVISQITEVADVVLIDAPPMAVSDALIIASLVDGVLLVTTGGRTRANELTNVVEALSRSGTNLTGVVVNRARLQSESYYYYQSYYTEDSGPAQGPPNDDGGSDGDSRDRRRVPTPFGRRSTGAEHRGTSGGK